MTAVTLCHAMKAMIWMSRREWIPKNVVAMVISASNDANVTTAICITTNASSSAAAACRECFDYDCYRKNKIPAQHDTPRETWQ